MPAAEIAIDARLAKGLIAAQFPQWSDLPLRAAPTIGWDNALFRLGTDLVVRIPRRQLGADLVQIEHRWLGQIVPRLPLRAPAPVGLGKPCSGFPWHWSVCPWLPGQMAAVARRVRWDEVANQLAGLLHALHVEAPTEAPVHPFGRGRSLAARDAPVRRLIAQWPAPSQRSALAAAWDRATTAPEWTGPALWLHGDLHPANLLVSHGRLSGVLDFGDLCSGDPAIDLLSAWMLLPRTSREILHEASSTDDATWERGRGWALALSLAMLERSSNNQVIGAVGHRGIHGVIEDLSDPSLSGSA